ncbi:hypothetical protein LEP1GSC185_0691 [Leptospira licerasiae serovar Varillal str. VAR 010]|nr:hypothetical protein LEP1GSC185_0691 [Leptospira licerasiae serovar Varillal str. VAR 010]
MIVKTRSNRTGFLDNLSHPGVGKSLFIEKISRSIQNSFSDTGPGISFFSLSGHVLKYVIFSVLP